MNESVRRRTWRMRATATGALFAIFRRVFGAQGWDRAWEARASRESAPVAPPAGGEDRA